MNDRGALNLRNGIIMQAVDDYKNALKKRDKQIPVLWTTDSFLIATKIYHNRMRARWNLQELRSFFFGKWFAQLCDLDPQQIIDHLENEDKIKKNIKNT